MPDRQFYIELDFTCHAFHGLYEKERIEGNVFGVHLVLGWRGPAHQSHYYIQETIDYTEVFALVREVMDQPEDLLETVSARILDSLHLKYKQLNDIKVKVTKQKPPIAGYSGTVSVTCHQTF